VDTLVRNGRVYIRVYAMLSGVCISKIVASLGQADVHLTKLLVISKVAN
jgi:hypothetical protein